MTNGVHFYRDHRGEWRWTYVAANGRTLAVSSEGYHNLADAQHGAGIVTGPQDGTTFTVTPPPEDTQ